VANDARQGKSLSQAIELARYIGYRGFRAYAFFGGASNNAFALDSDLGRVEWTRHFDVANVPAGTPACPGGMTAGVTRSTPLTEAAAAAGGRGGGGRGGGAVGAVGEPGQGAVQIAAIAAGGGRGGRGGAAGGSGRGGGGRGPANIGTNSLFA